MECDRGFGRDIQDIIGAQRRSHLPRVGRHFGVPGEVMPKLKPEEQVSLAKNS